MKTSTSLCVLFALAAAASATAMTTGCGDDDAATPAATNNTVDSGTPPANDAAPAPTYDFSALEQYLFGAKWVSEGVVVQHEGKIVYEKYAAGFDDKKRHITYSVSKSVGSALVGIAVNEGILKLDESICTYVPAPQGADATFCETKVEHVLQMRSGLQWQESYDNPNKSNVLPMLYGDEPDMGLYVARQPRANKAGEKWLYSSGDANLLALALKNALAGKDMRAWAKEKLFDPAGLTSVFFEVDRSGTLVFSSSCFMSVRDMAKLGQLYLDDGMNGATRVLPSSWITYTHTPAPPVATPTPRTPGAAPGDTGGSYGAAFWLNAAKPDAPADTLAYPDTPTDMYSAEGHWGQKIFIVPSRRLVVARVGNDRDPVFDSGPMMQKAVAAVDAVIAAKGGK